MSDEKMDAKEGVEIKQPELPPPTPPKVEVKKMRCPIHYYTGDGIVKDIPPVMKGHPDTRGTYCPLCFQDWMWRNITKMQEVK